MLLTYHRHLANRPPTNIDPCNPAKGRITRSVCLPNEVNAAFRCAAKAEAGPGSREGYHERSGRRGGFRETSLVWHRVQRGRDEGSFEHRGVCFFFFKSVVGFSTRRLGVGVYNRDTGYQ